MNTPCTWTAEGQLKDNCSEQVTTRRDLRSLSNSHSDVVCLLLQLNCTELRQEIIILILGLRTVSDYGLDGRDSIPDRGRGFFL
jgi:hypothetical protein